MLQPNGPLPPEIYWRRRLLAMGVLAAALVVLLAIVFLLRGGGSPAAAPAAVSASTTSSSATASSSGSATSTTTDSDSGGSGGPIGPTQAASASASPASASSTSASPAPAPAASPAPAAAPAPAPPPGQCPDQSLAVKVSVEQPSYPAGTEPKFGVIVTNISANSCTRDIGSGQAQILAYSLDGQQRLWASTDCFKDAPNVRSFNPGQQAGFTVSWSTKTSQPACVGSRDQVKPGAYTVVAQLGSLRSTPEPFNIV